MNYPIHVSCGPGEGEALILPPIFPDKVSKSE